MTPREYIKWRCPFCNGYPAVRESRRDKLTDLGDGQQPGLSDPCSICGPLEDSGAVAVKEALCYTAG